MTYCLAIKVEQGLVFASDSRTNAGVDQVSTYSKMHVFEADGARAVCLLSAGNLATSQAVVRKIRSDNEASAKRCLNKVGDISEAADYIGALSRAEQRKHQPSNQDSFNVDASFIVGGQIGDNPPQLFMVYPEGNYISAAEQAPYLQVGELKYGKPILDRMVKRELSIDVAARCALVSMDSAMRSNASVGPPIELLVGLNGSGRFESRLVFEGEDPFLLELRHAWQEGLEKAFERLPGLPLRKRPVQLGAVDSKGD